MTNRVNGSAGARVPSRASILALILAGSSSMLGTFWIMTVGMFDGRHLVGFLFGALLTATLLVQAINRATTRHLAMIQAEYARHERAANTGTWLDEDGNVALTVRWDPAERAYFAAGRIPAWRDPEHEERRLKSWEVLSLNLNIRKGWTSVDDVGTRAIRARLMRPG
jgi:hypothetical protein